MRRNSDSYLSYSLILRPSSHLLLPLLQSPLSPFLPSRPRPLLSPSFHHLCVATFCFQAFAGVAFAAHLVSSVRVHLSSCVFLDFALQLMVILVQESGSIRDSRSTITSARKTYSQSYTTDPLTADGSVCRWPASNSPSITSRGFVLYIYYKTQFPMHINYTHIY